MSAVKNFPAYYDGPNGERVLCNSEDDVPKGYTSGWENRKDPAKRPAPTQAGTKTLAETGAAAPEPKDAGTNDGKPAVAASGELDAHGHPWSEKLHAKSKGKTKDGLWRMGVGKARPAPAAGYPKPVLDL